MHACQVRKLREYGRLQHIAHVDLQTALKQEQPLSHAQKIAEFRMSPRQVKQHLDEHVIAQVSREQSVGREQGAVRSERVLRSERAAGSDLRAAHLQQRCWAVKSGLPAAACQCKEFGAARVKPPVDRRNVRLDAEAPARILYDHLPLLLPELQLSVHS